jgi:hypothetical protein
MSGRKYYAEREGVNSQVDIDFETLVDAIKHIVKTYEGKYYFQQATGYNCVDQGAVQGTWGADLRIFIFKEIRMNEVWPIEQHIANFDIFKLFTVVEFLYDHVSKPINGYHHDFSYCGWHYSEFDKDSGQEEFRIDINKFLELYEEGFELQPNGEIWRKVSSGISPVLASTPPTSNPAAIDTRIQDAISKYHRHNASLTDKKDAARTLADVLEHLRPQIRTVGAVSQRDENDLFNIINNYDIRHHRRDQQGEYNREVFYDWMFYGFLNSINLMLRYAVETGQTIT